MLLTTKTTFMASGFFALLDDIATLMDDVSVMAKVAGKKTAGILGDDLAVNAEKASGFMSDRVIPVLWKITKGSLLNKIIILPIAFLLSAFVPVAITVILIIGGLYLAYEGAEKIYEFFVPHAHHDEKPALQDRSEEELLAYEKEKVKSAILTDFILSVALLATVGVYGIVALIVRMDEFGAKLINLNEEDDSFSDKVGIFLVNALPKVIKGLSIIGTIALLLVSGGIFRHNLHFVHDLFHSWPGMLADLLLGLVVGFVVLLLIMGGKKIFKPTAA